MNRQFNHKAIRVMIGVVAILMPFACMLLAYNPVKSSISSYYWSDSRDIFVGFLVTAGFLLSTYNGSGKRGDVEFFLSKFAGLFAVLVALFPTNADSLDQSEPYWVLSASGFIGLAPHNIHYGAAVLLFACLISIMWIFSKRAARKGKPGRSMIYRFIALSMMIGIAGLSLLGNWLGWVNTVLIVEIWGLLFFGAGWLLAGLYRSGACHESESDQVLGIG